MSINTHDSLLTTTQLLINLTKKHVVGVEVLKHVVVVVIHVVEVVVVHEVLV